MSPASVAAIILAAGASRRLGQPKQLAQLGPETLLERSTRIARESDCEPILVVLGAEADLIQSRCDLTGSHVLINSRWPEGMATSIHTALGWLQSNAATAESAGAILMVCDQPAITPEHLRALAGTGRLTASSYAGRQGVPAFFPAALFTQLAQLTGDSGARDLLRTAPAIPLPHGDLDIDTPATLELARQLFPH